MEEVRNWLRSFGLLQYDTKLEEDGWDNLHDLFDIDADDLETCIPKPGHRRRFLLAVGESRNGTIETTTSVRIDDHSEIAYSDEEKICIIHPRTNCLESWLERYGLGRYISKFKEEGWDIPQVLAYMTDENIEACIEKPGHRKKFRLALRNGTNFTENLTSIEDWLKSKDLEDYITKFEDDGWDTLDVLLEIGEEDLRNCINKPGHRKRFQRAVTTDKSRKTCKDTPKGADKEETKDDWSIRDAAVDTSSASNTDESVEGKLRPPVQFTLDSCDNESTSSVGGDTKYEDTSDNADHLDGMDTKFISSEDNGEEEISEAEDSEEDTLSGSLKRTVSLPPSLICYKPRYVAVGEVFKTVNRVDEKRKKRDSFKRQMQAALHSFREKEPLYVETRAFCELVDIVEANHWAVIIGVPGDGKTAMAAHLSLMYARKRYEHIELHFAREWKDFVDGKIGRISGKKQFILIDDIFGRMSIDERKVSEWSSIIDLMQRVVKQRAGSLIVVCTSRKYVFNDVKTKLAQFSSFRKTSVIDMTEPEFALTRDEKLSIWTKYATRYGVKTRVPDCINKDSNTPHGFPHCVDLFATNTFLQEKGLAFFENPMDNVCREINNFKEYDKIKFGVLCLVFFNNNKLSEDRLEKIANNWRDTGKIENITGIYPRPRASDLKNALDGLKNTYISESDNSYSISHDSIRENLAFILIKENPTSAIDYMDFEYLTDHTRCFGQKSEDDSTIYVLKQSHNKLLVDRMIKEIKNGNVVTVCAHQAWNNTEFVAEFIRCLLTTEHNQDICDIFNTKDSSTAYIFDFSLSDALRFFGHRKAVKQIWADKDLEQHFKQSQDFADLVETPTDLSFDGQLSRYLCQVMDDIGASNASREFQINSALSMEILDTVCTFIADQKFTCYIFGSHSEGTRIGTHIPKLESDVNYLFCLYDREVVQSVSEVRTDKTEDKVEYLLAIKDDITKPGYVKLQIVQDGEPQTKTKENLPLGMAYDYKDRIVVYKRPDKIHVDEVSGARTTTDIVTGHHAELCHSYRCRTWPDEAEICLNRTRHHNWPSRYTIEQMKSLGFFLVPVGSPGSIEKRLEWKISFLLQERLLMSTLNDTQYKCYIILKMINNDIISYLVKEPVLVSYHLKTCMFYVIENTPNDIWRPENLLDCIQVCLKCILKWTIDGICPNYFIPEENLFHRRVHGEIQTMLRNVLSNLLSSTFHFFPHVQCGNLGPRLNKIITGDPGYVKRDNDLVPDRIRLYLKAAKFIALVRVRILCKCKCKELKDCVISHFDAVKRLKETEDITEHSKEETRRAISLVTPYVEISLMTNLVAREVELSKEKNAGNLLLSKLWPEISIRSDQYSARLKQATFLHMCGYSESSLVIVQSLKTLCGPSMISICGCEYHHIIVDDDLSEKARVMTEPDFRKTYCMPCVVFLPTERDLIPDVLGYEMERSNGRSADSKAPTFHFWYEWAVVDSKVLLYLLLYLNHTKLNKASEAEADVEMLRNIILEDQNLGHRETGWNVLGWIYRQERKEAKAKDCFKTSLKLQSEFNAANIHLSSSRISKDIL